MEDISPTFIECLSSLDFLYWCAGIEECFIICLKCLLVDFGEAYFHLMTALNSPLF